MSLTTPGLSASSGEGLTQLSARVDSLFKDVEALKSQMAAQQPGPPREEVLQAIDQVRQMTEAIFGRVLEFEETCDVEDETWQVIVVHVEDSGEIDEMVSRFNAWHDRLSAVSSSVRGRFRLLISPRE
jgi:hypothetical protein